jgi:DNA-binding LacI/PurR family transcriptional regulator
MTSENTGSDGLSRESLAAQMAGRMRVEISAMRPGDRLPSMRKTCRRYGVSINTVGSVVALLEQEGLVVRRAGAGVFVGERAGRARIGILSELDIFDSRISPYWRRLAGETKTALEAAGHLALPYFGNSEPGGAPEEPTCPRFWEDAAAGRLDGAVILDVPTTKRWHDRVQRIPIPAVGAWTFYDATLDVSGIMRAAVTRLAAQGCRRLGLIAWHGEADFSEAVKAQGLTTCVDWIRADRHPALRGAGWEEFRAIWSARAGRPDGLVILDDILFADAQLAMLELDVRVPADLRLALLTSRGAPPFIRFPLTAFEIDPAEVAAEYEEMLRRRMAGELDTPVTRRVSFREVAAQPAGERPVGSDRLSVIGTRGAPAACSG